MPFFFKKNMQKNISSNNPNLLFAKALEYQRLNDIENTENLCKYILNLYPDHLGAEVILASIYVNSEYLIDEGISLIESALKKEATNFFIHNLYGVALMKIGKYQEARQSFLNAIRLNSNAPDIYFNLGVLNRATNEYNEAISFYSKCLEINEQYANAFFNRGNVYLDDLSDYKNAISDYQQFIRLIPNNPYGYYNLGKALSLLNRHDEAIIHYEKAITLKPDYAEAYVNCGLALSFLNRHDEAIICYEKAITLKPDYAEAYVNCGSALSLLNRHDEAIICCEKAITLKPDYAEAYFNFGKALNLSNRHNGAIIYYEKAIALKPDYAEAYVNCGSVLGLLNRHDEALIHYEKAIAFAPDYDYLPGWIMHSKQHALDWNGYDDLRENIIKGTASLKNSSHPFIILSMTDDLKIQKISAEVFSKAQTGQLKNSKIIPMKYGHKKIKIGYFSADFHNHATMHLIAEMLESHNKEKFEIIGFSYGIDVRDDWSERARKSFDGFYNVFNMNDERVADLSRQLEIDIAIELKGYTQESRPAIFFYKAAPIQINYLGYPGTLGAEYIDYIIADKNLIPENKKVFYTENIIYLPGCYQPNCAKRDIDKTKISRKEFGLPEDAFIYCAFNNAYKITPQTLLSWAKILSKVTNSVIWVLSDSENTNENILREFNAKGIDSQRIIFAKRMPIEKHLARLQLADLFLDTFPYNAHTTASDALRVGLPVLTMMGQSFASRVASSLLKQLELTELITENEKDYESIAIQLGSNIKNFNSIKDKVSNNLQKTDLFNPKVITTNIELAFEKAYEIYLNDEAPRDIYIN